MCIQFNKFLFETCTCRFQVNALLEIKGWFTYVIVHTSIQITCFDKNSTMVGYDIATCWKLSGQVQDGI